MKLVGRYTLALVATLTVLLATLTYFRLAHDRDHYEEDMKSDHQVVGRVLQQSALDLWRGTADATAATEHAIALANASHGATHFAWDPHPRVSAETQQFVGDELVSQFPVVDGARVPGAIVVTESLREIAGLVWHGMLFSVGSLGIIIVLSLVMSLLFGNWLVARPIALLVAKARRVAQRDFTGDVTLPASTELGTLAAEMNAMSTELDKTLARLAVEREALRHAERLSTVGRLAAGVAHELGTPLAVIGGHAQMIAGAEVTGDGAVESARVIDREAARIAQIVRQLLDFARRKGTEGTASDVGKVARDCLDRLSGLAAKSKVVTDVVVRDAGRAAIDELGLQHVLTNLFVNAIHAMPGGGALTVTIGREVAAPPSNLQDRRARVRIDVRDTGGGIAADALPHIFEPFFTTKPPGEGTGLGLSVVYGIVSDHGGWIAVDSSPAGTAMSVFLEPEVAP